MRRLRRLLYLAVLLTLYTLAAVPARAQNAAVRGWCETGATKTTTSGLVSTTLVQVSYPQCLVTVFVHGAGLATIFSDAAGTPLSNPFTASLNGQWIFYGTSTQRVDVQLSGGLPVPGFPTPVTLSDITIGGGGGGSVTGCVPAGLTNALLKNNGTGGCVASAAIDDGVTFKVNDFFNPQAGAEVDGNFSGTGIGTISYQTFNSGAVVTNTFLAKLLASGSLVNTSTSDTTGIIGVASGATSSAGVPVSVTTFGLVSVTTDGVCTAGQLVVNSPTLAGTGHCTSVPGTSQVVGTILQTAASAGTLFMYVYPFVQVPLPSTGGGSIPGAPTGSLQFNLNGSATFAGSNFIYAPADATHNICLATCSTITSLPGINAGIGLISSDTKNDVVLGAETGTGAFAEVDTIVTNPFFEAISYDANTLIGGNTFGGKCYSSAGGPPCAISYFARPGDIGTESISGQDIVGYGSQPLLNKIAGQTVNTVSSFVAMSPLGTNGGGTTLGAPAERAANYYGLVVQDMLGLANTESAAIKIFAQASAIANSYSIKVDAGGGVARFGSGIADDTLTSGQCVQTSTIGGFIRLVTTGSACGAGGGSVGGSTTQFQYNNAGVLGGTSSLTYDNVNNVPLLAVGAITTDINPLAVSWTTNNAATVFHGLQMVATNTAFNTGSFNYMLCGGASGTLCFTIDPAGNAATPGSFATGGTSVAGNIYFPQGPLPSLPVTNIWQIAAPTSIPTAYQWIGPSAAAAGSLSANVSGTTVTLMQSGDANHSTTVTTGSGASIGSTILCSSGNCPVGTYRVNAYLDITTACATTGTYLVNLIYTDDQGAKTIPINIQGTGATPTTGVLTLASTANYGQAAQILRSTGATSINYSTTATACGTGGPMIGKLYLSLEPVQ